VSSVRPAPSKPAAPPDPAALLAEAIASAKETGTEFQKTGDIASLVPKWDAARLKAETAYPLFVKLENPARAAECLVAMADLDRRLIMVHPEKYQVEQDPVKQKYSEALALAEKGNDNAVRLKALLGLARASSNSKDYAVSAQYLARAIPIASASGTKDDLFNAYEMQASVELSRANLAAADDSIGRAFQLVPELKDPILAWYAYSGRADVSNFRANHCDEARNYDLCRQLTDAGIADLERARELAERLGYGFLKASVEMLIADRKLVAEKVAVVAADAVELAKLDSLVTKPSDVVLRPHFAQGAAPDIAAQVREATKQQDATPESRFEPLKPMTDGAMDEWEGRPDAALQHYLEAVNLIEGDRRKQGDVEGTSAYLSQYIDAYYSAALQRLDRKQFAEAFDLLERSRARALSSMMETRKIYFRSPQLQDLFSQSVALDARVGEAQSDLMLARSATQPDPARIRELQAKVDALQTERSVLQARLQQASPNLAASLGEAPPVTLSAAQAAARQGGYDLLYYVVLNNDILIWHIGADSVRAVMVSFPRSKLAVRVAAFRRILSDVNYKFDERRAAELFLLLVNPVLPDIHTHRLVIVPHEDLANLPYQVLKKPGGAFLGEEFEISYAPSASVLAVLKGRPDFARGHLLALADPAIDNAVSEVHAIEKLYPGRAKTVTDALATKQSLKDSIGGNNLIHLSVHGAFLSRDPLLSHLKLQPSGGDDGHFTAAEMFGLPLPENSLVVLSACETGIVQASRGSEVLGIVPALFFAGASTLVLSSWQVDSKSTALWMETFYREVRTKSTGEAARLALLAVKKQPGFQHPFYWAPFMVSGR
jgi:CHAT domain-containing protein